MNTSEHTLINANGQKIFVTEYTPHQPTAQAVLFVHGLGSSQAEFGPIPGRLADQGILALTFDLSGHGQSEGTRGLLSEPIVLNDIRCVLDTFKNSYPNCQYVIAGHSLGAHAALVSTLHMNLIKACILIAPQKRSGDSLPFFKRWLIRLLGTMYALCAALPDWYVKNPARYDDLFVTANAVQKARQSGFMAERINLKICAYTKNINNLDLVRRLSKPVLFVAPRQDKQVPPEKIRELFDHTLSSQKHFVGLKDCGHSPFFEDSHNELLHTMMNFINSYP